MPVSGNVVIDRIFMLNTIYIATSLDGYIARLDGSIDWLMDIPNPDGSDFGFGDFIKRIDAIVMGRNTYQTVEAFGSWPYTKPVFLLSTTLKKDQLKYRDKVEILSGTPEEIVNTLNGRNYRNLYIDGGETIRRFLERGLIDEMIITKIPVLLGSGIPLFGGIETEQKFRHAKTEILNDSLVKSYYEKI
ncbi:MAG TPA: dihydrofolate reductase family protein [Melioribacteraceae bacterium]|nr:dihydrofolate reductase family protein [Melioribacteraceae bacterium]